MLPIFEPVDTILCFSSRSQQLDTMNMQDFPDLVALDMLSSLHDSLGTYNSVSYNLDLLLFPV